MKIQILGSGCINCKKLEENAKMAAQELGVEFEIEKITDINKIIEMGVMMTPGLAIDGEVKSSGKVLSKNQIKEIIEKELKK
ncbi:MAG: thioredoxin family protein [Exilispira sp.]|jgi:small redox-active disulfide protein 2|nr:thioredoxin family protein [Exilispira sp.]